MAFVRWRGRCCELLATVYEKTGPPGKSSWPNFHDCFVDKWTKEKVTEGFPGIAIDWLAVDQALAQGPPGTRTNDIPLEHSDMATIEHHLRKWAAEADKVNSFNEANCLRKAANILTGIRLGF